MSSAYSGCIEIGIILRFVTGDREMWNLTTIIRASGPPRERDGNICGRAPRSGVGAVGKWPAGATAKSLAQAGHLSTAVVIADLR